MGVLTHLISTAEALALRRDAASTCGGGSGAVATREDFARVCAPYRYNVLRVVPGFRRTGVVAQGLTSRDGKPSGVLVNEFRSLTLGRRPRCRCCGQYIEPAAPNLHGEMCPSS